MTSPIDLRSGILVTEALIRVARAQYAWHRAYTDVQQHKRFMPTVNKQRKRIEIAVEGASDYIDALSFQLNSQRRNRTAAHSKSVADKMHTLTIQYDTGKLMYLQYRFARVRTCIYEYWVSRASTDTSEDEWEHVVHACLPTEAVQLHAQIRAWRWHVAPGFSRVVRRASSYLLSWRNPYFTTDGEDERGTVPPKCRLGVPFVEFISTAIGIAFLMFASLYIFGFCVRQDNQERINANQAAVANLGRNLIVDLIFSFPACLFLVHVCFPQLAARIVHPELVGVDWDHLLATSRPPDAPKPRHEQAGRHPRRASSSISTTTPRDRTMMLYIADRLIASASKARARVEQRHDDDQDSKSADMTEDTGIITIISDGGTTINPLVIEQGVDAITEPFETQGIDSATNENSWGLPSSPLAVQEQGMDSGLSATNEDSWDLPSSPLSVQEQEQATSRDPAGAPLGAGTTRAEREVRVLRRRHDCFRAPGVLTIGYVCHITQALFFQAQREMRQGEAAVEEAHMRAMPPEDLEAYLVRRAFTMIPIK